VSRCVGRSWHVFAATVMLSVGIHLALNLWLVVRFA
jgi:hypothetical protein